MERKESKKPSDQKELFDEYELDSTFTFSKEMEGGNVVSIRFYVYHDDLKCLDEVLLMSLPPEVRKEFFYRAFKEFKKKAGGDKSIYFLIQFLGSEQFVQEGKERFEVWDKIKTPKWHTKEERDERLGKALKKINKEHPPQHPTDKRLRRLDGDIW